MALSDIEIRAVKPLEKEWKLADERGLYLLVTPRGGKLWRFKFRHFGKEKKFSLGAYAQDERDFFGASNLSRYDLFWSRRR